MPAPKGHAKWGGRTKGTTNKKNEAVLKYLSEKGYDPIKGMLDLANHDDDSIKLSARKELLSYCYPKLKAVELSGEIAKIEPAIKEESLSDRIKSKVE
jgi:hypothetical protein